MAIAGCALMTIIILVSLAAPLLTPYDPTFMDVTQKALPVSREHLLESTYFAVGQMPGFRKKPSL